MGRSGQRSQFSIFVGIRRGFRYLAAIGIEGDCIGGRCSSHRFDTLDSDDLVRSDVADGVLAIGLCGQRVAIGLDRKASTLLVAVSDVHSKAEEAVLQDRRSGAIRSRHSVTRVSSLGGQGHRVLFHMGNRDGKLVAGAEQLVVADGIPVDIHLVAILVEGQQHHHRQIIGVVDALRVAKNRCNILSGAIFVCTSCEVGVSDVSAQRQHYIGILRTQLIPDRLTIARSVGRVQIILRVKMRAIPIHESMRRQDHIFIWIIFDDIFGPVDSFLRGRIAQREDQVFAAAAFHMPIVAVQFILTQHVVLIGTAEPGSVGAVLIVGEVIVEPAGIIVIAAHGHPGDPAVIELVHGGLAGIPLIGIVGVDHIAQMHNSLNVIVVLVICDPLGQLFVALLMVLGEELGIRQGNHGIIALGKVRGEPIHKIGNIVFVCGKVTENGGLGLLEGPCGQQAVAAGVHGSGFQRSHIGFDLFIGTDGGPDADVGDLALEILVVVAAVEGLAAGAAVVTAHLQRLGGNDRVEGAVVHRGDQCAVEIAFHGIGGLIEGEGHMNPFVLAQIHTGNDDALGIRVLTSAALLPVQAGLAVLINLEVDIAQVIVVITGIHVVAADDAAAAGEILRQLDGGLKGAGNIGQPLGRAELIRCTLKRNTLQIQAGIGIVIVISGIDRDVLPDGIGSKIPLLGAGRVFVPAGEGEAGLGRSLGRSSDCSAHPNGLVGDLFGYRSAGKPKGHSVFRIRIDREAHSFHRNTVGNLIFEHGITIHIARAGEVPQMGQTVLAAGDGLVVILLDFVIGADVIPHAHLVDLAVHVDRAAVVITAEAEPLGQLCAGRRKARGIFRSRKRTVDIGANLLVCRVPNHGDQHPLAGADVDVIKKNIGAAAGHRLPVTKGIVIRYFNSPAVAAAHIVVHDDLSGIGAGVQLDPGFHSGGNIQCALDLNILLVLSIKAQAAELDGRRPGLRCPLSKTFGLYRDSAVCYQIIKCGIRPQVSRFAEQPGVCQTFLLTGDGLSRTGCNLIGAACIAPHTNLADFAVQEVPLPQVGSKIQRVCQRNIMERACAFGKRSSQCTVDIGQHISVDFVSYQRDQHPISGADVDLVANGVEFAADLLTIHPLPVAQGIVRIDLNTPTIFIALEVIVHDDLPAVLASRDLDPHLHGVGDGDGAFRYSVFLRSIIEGKTTCLALLSGHCGRNQGYGNGQRQQRGHSPLKKRFEFHKVSFTQPMHLLNGCVF